MQTFATRDRRVKPSRPIFAIGLESTARLVRSWSAGSWVFDLTEDPEAIDRDGGYPWTLYAVAPSGRPEVHGFDSLKDAETMAWHLSTPPPVEPATHEARCAAFEAFMAAEAIEDAKVTRRTRFEPTAADVAWLREHPVAGGAPEPDWDSLYAESRERDAGEVELSDDWGGAFIGHEA